MPVILYLSGRVSGLTDIFLERGCILKKIRFIFILAVMMMALCGCRVQYIEEETSTETSQQKENNTTAAVETIYLNMWYYDENYTEYLEQCAGDYEAANSNVEITLTLVPEGEYVDSLVQGTLNNGENIDLYMIDNDKLEEVKLAGLAEENTMSDIYTVYNYADKALAACSYNDHLIAYPLSFTVPFMVYNKAYITENIPTSFEQIKTFADTFEDTTGSIRNIFTCDLNDVFFNYGFLGNALEIGGMNGDDKSKIFDITDELRNAVAEYQSLIAFFSIDINTIDYYSCLRDFENGSIIYTLADAEMLKLINEDIANGESFVEYGVMPFLDLTESLATSPLSITHAVAVNPFCENVEVAESFAKYVTYTNADALYEVAGMVPCRRMDTENEVVCAIYESYEKSTPKLKLMHSDEFYALLEVSMHLMARSEDDVASLSAARNYLQEQWSNE